MHLNGLSPGKGAKKVAKRRGRGHSAGQGKTCGRGQKGQHARSGGYHKVGFEGGQMPLQRRLPKRGFTPRNRVEYQVVNVARLERVDGDNVTPQTLRAAGLIGSGNQPVKILGNGDLKKAYKVAAHAFSKSAREKIEKAGGEVREIAG